MQAATLGRADRRGAATARIASRELRSVRVLVRQTCCRARGDGSLRLGQVQGNDPAGIGSNGSGKARSIHVGLLRVSCQRPHDATATGTPMLKCAGTSTSSCKPGLNGACSYPLSSSRTRPEHHRRRRLRPRRRVRFNPSGENTLGVTKEPHARPQSPASPASSDAAR